MMKDITTFARRASSAPTSTGRRRAVVPRLAADSSFVADTVFLPGVVSEGVRYGDRPAHDAAGTLIASDDDSGDLPVFTNPLNEQSGAHSLRLSLARLIHDGVSGGLADVA